ncbi:MAG: phosphate uptake regulator PhoU [Candidatus Bathyarchaeota archaeon]|nr:phosphate uptake regulator PhoU [Candidatus Bathyarchaeum sp.]
MSETRKIQKIGNTLYISIPKSWTNTLMLKHGEKVTLVTQQDGSISIYPKPEDSQRREITLTMTSKSSSQSLKRGIIAAYLDGFDTIELKTETTFTEDQHESIRKTINSLFGLEVIEVTGNRMMIVCLLKQTMPVNKAITRIHNVILSMFGETISAIKTQNTDLTKGLTRRTKDIKRLLLVTNRLLRSSILFPKPSQTDDITLIDCVDYLQILHITSEITGNLNKIAENINSLAENQLPPPIMKSLVETGNNIQNLYDSSVQALLSKDIPLANNVLDASFDLETLWNTCLQANDKKELSSLTLANLRIVIDSLEQIQQHTHEIANTSIDRTEAANARASTLEAPSKKKQSIFGKKLGNTR